MRYHIQSRGSTSPARSERRIGGCVLSVHTRPTTPASRSTTPSDARVTMGISTTAEVARTEMKWMSVGLANTRRAGMSSWVISLDPSEIATNINPARAAAAPPTRM